MRVVAATVACLATLALASTAQAAQRYAAPEGSGPEPCAQSAPCSLKQAVTKAISGDEVIVTGGTYTVKEAIYPEGASANVYIHGDFGGPMPRIVGSETFLTLYIVGNDSRLAYLEMTNTGTNAMGVLCAAGSQIERVKATAAGEYAIGINQANDCVVRDSIALASGAKATALSSLGNTVGSFTVARNVTAVATGADSRGAAVSCGACFGAPQTLDLRNVIASGSGVDIEATGGSSTAKIIVSNSNFDSSKGGAGESILDQGGNQTAPPLFRDAAAGDYREAAGSPTIDAGTNNLLGATDFDGNPRTVGAAPDIGAFEYVPPVSPVPPPVPPGEIQSLTIAPRVFRAVNAGGAILSAKKKARAPIGTTITYTLSAGAAVSFAVERKVSGRRVGKRCVKKTKANATKKKCPLFKPVKGGFSHSGAAGGNRFKFSGRIAKALAPGSYRLTGKTSASSRAASFRIVR
jgi:hypothetical protein